MSTTTKVILAIIGVLGVGALIYFLAKPKEAAKPSINTGSGNNLSLSFGTPANSASGTVPADFGFNGINNDGDKVVNGMTAAQYLAAGYSQADVNLIFS